MSAAKHDVFQAIADPTRRAVLQLLAEENEMPISKITSYFPMSRTAIAKHLQILSEVKLVRGRKAGREKLYRLYPEPLGELKQWLAFFDQYWDNKLSILKHVVEATGDNELKVVEPQPDEKEK
ncbi:helix-turn-helix transcriptional regulator [Alkalihalobacillus sp. AL-G]|uniref:ArsR/SmtB family transcription factor n=1 Tax=Alkalihalobacillus sp. AL-G TaxID=2926399 RepID=UPI00272D6D6F|nr:metalloregulator ArsR/SmtB family transcription factor [Alkalihalobacillus sp. AL-G]WLD94427.1 metalloregulator ArsR/SmtB family transcription factor [Alkalihalobacillus sp. AL-G]